MFQLVLHTRVFGDNQRYTHSCQSSISFCCRYSVVVDIVVAYANSPCLKCHTLHLCSFLFLGAIHPRPGTWDHYGSNCRRKCSKHLSICLRAACVYVGGGIETIIANTNTIYASENVNMWGNNIAYSPIDPINLQFTGWLPDSLAHWLPGWSIYSLSVPFVCRCVHCSRRAHRAPFGGNIHSMASDMRAYLLFFCGTFFVARTSFFLTSNFPSCHSLSTDFVCEMCSRLPAHIISDIIKVLHKSPCPVRLASRSTRIRNPCAYDISIKYRALHQFFLLYFVFFFALFVGSSTSLLCWHGGLYLCDVHFWPMIHSTADKREWKRVKEWDFQYVWKTFATRTWNVCWCRFYFCRIATAYFHHHSKFKVHSHNDWINHRFQVCIYVLQLFFSCLCFLVFTHIIIITIYSHHWM